MRKRLNPLVGPNSERGISAVVVAVGLLVFIGMTALAVDLSVLYVARNELQNAADAGALAGARWLYNDDGTLVNENANQIAYAAATANRSRQLPVEVNWTSGNAGDVQRGHWSFATRTFTANASTTPPDLWNKTTAELDADPNFINAVRVITRRQATPVHSFFARLWGNESTVVATEAVGYLGYSGTLRPGDADQPIVICKQSLVDDDGRYLGCTFGRFINSGENVSGHETGGWTDFNQDNPCQGGTNAQTVKSLVCGEGNPGTLLLGQDMATNGGDIQSAFGNFNPRNPNQSTGLIGCWWRATGGTHSWELILPVIDCQSNNVGPCDRLLGAVAVRVLWITDAGEDPGYTRAPFRMDGWSSSDTDGRARWASFTAYFKLVDVDHLTPAPYGKKIIYFQPECEVQELRGTTGGENFGILARIPVLVK